MKQYSLCLNSMIRTDNLGNITSYVIDGEKFLSKIDENGITWSNYKTCIKVYSINKILQIKQIVEQKIEEINNINKMNGHSIVSIKFSICSNYIQTGV